MQNQSLQNVDVDKRNVQNPLYYSFDNASHYDRHSSIDEMTVSVPVVRQQFRGPRHQPSQSMNIELNSNDIKLGNDSGTRPSKPTLFPSTNDTQKKNRPYNIGKESLGMGTQNQPSSLKNIQPSPWSESNAQGE